ncbi:hypothetical protein ACTXT7_010248 [Hymenolepis weldensis]
MDAFTLMSEIEEKLGVWTEKYGSTGDRTKRSIASLQAPEVVSTRTREQIGNIRFSRHPECYYSALPNRHTQHRVRDSNWLVVSRAHIHHTHTDILWFVDQCLHDAIESQCENGEADSEESDLFFEDFITFRDGDFERTFPGQLNEFRRTGKCSDLDLEIKVLETKVKALEKLCYGRLGVDEPNVAKLVLLRLMTFLSGKKVPQEVIISIVNKAHKYAVLEEFL